MKKINLLDVNNVKVLEYEKDFEFEGICGSEDGILWEDSLEQLFEANDIEVVFYKDNEWISLKQNNMVVTFRMFLGKEGSSFESDHIDFDFATEIRPF